MRLTLLAFGAIALSLHLHARQVDGTPPRDTGTARVAVVSGHPILIR